MQMINLFHSKCLCTRKTHDISLRRSDAGIPIIEAKTPGDIYFALGWVHAYDRYAQMVLLSTLGQGRATEMFFNSPLLFKIDLLMKKMDFFGQIQHELFSMSEYQVEIYDYLRAYCDGVRAIATSFFKKK